MNARFANVFFGLAIGFPGMAAFAADQSAHVQVDFSERLGPMEMNRMALGQGGLSDHPMWSDRIPEIKSLHPAMIRLFVQEYFKLLAEPGRFHFETLDRSVDTILATGAKPLMCICFKPHTLFPKVDQDIVEPEDYSAWEQLIFALVKHYQEKKAGIEYWEIGNEPDIGEDGGCPYRFKPESYSRYYQRTAGAILKADPAAKVGGPALAGSRSAILPRLLNFCESNGVPLHFVSWHIYSSDPKSIRGTVEYVQSLLKAHPALKPETILDEWNMDLMNPPRDPRFQPAFVCETIWQMKDAGLAWSCYYHIRDWHVDLEQFEPFMSRQGAAFMARWWNRMPQFDGLFDYQNHVRPAYFAFKLLSQLTGDRCRATSDYASVHLFASHDEQMRLDNLLIWNFSATPAALRLDCQGLPPRSLRRHLVLDAVGADSDENARLRPDSAVRIDQAHMSLDVTLDGYSIQYWSFE
jgi:xylan 1,4-beta-xylosidase